jgi:hypothetical protein
MGLEIYPESYPKNMSKKFKMFFTTFSSQNPSEKFKMNFMIFLTAIIQTGLGLVKISKLFSTHPEAFHLVFHTVANQRICAA